jgi:hypothetical protein
MSAAFIPLKSTRTSSGISCSHEIGGALARLADCGLIGIRVSPWLTLRLLRWSAPSAGAVIGHRHEVGGGAASGDCFRIETPAAQNRVGLLFEVDDFSKTDIMSAFKQ